MTGPAQPPAIAIATSIDLDDDELRLLHEALPDADFAVGEAAALHIPAMLEDDAPKGASGLQYSFDVDPNSVLVVALTSVSEAVVDQISRQLADDFWLGVKGVLARVRRRMPGAPVSSVQVQAPLPPVGQVPSELSLTALHAEYAGDDAWARAMTSATTSAVAERDRAVAAVAGPDGRIPEQMAHPGSRIVVYGFVEGSGTLEWHTEIEAG
jgi:hypothetical protein